MTSQPQPDRAETLKKTGELTDALKDIGASLDYLRKYGRRNRTLITLVAVLLAAVVALGIWVNHASNSAAAANVKATSATVAASAQRAASVAGCEQGNTYRAGTVASLDRLVIILEGSHPSAQVKQAAASYEAYVLAHNEPRNCQKAYPAPKAVAANGAS